MREPVDDRPDRPELVPGDDESWTRLSRGYRLAGLVTGAHRLGLLRLLAEVGDAPTAELADGLLADEQVVEWVCRGLRAAGIVEQDGERWQLTRAGIDLAASPGAAAELDALALDYDRFGRLDAHARQLAVGERPAPEETAGTGAARRAALRDAVRHADEHDAVLDRLVPQRPLCVVDVGGADGAFSRQLVERWPDAEAVVLEQPPMAEVAAEACADEDRVSVRAGDFLDGAMPEALPDGADVVVLSHVLQGLPTSAQRRLLCRAASALAPGGCIVSCELVLRADGAGPLDVVLWALGEAATGRLGTVLTDHDQETLVRAAGLAAVGSWSAAAGTHAVLGVRPDAGAQPALVLADPRQAPLEGENRRTNSASALRSVS